MKTNFKFVLILSLFALFSFNSCQNEVIQETQNPEETFAPNSMVANLMRSTASNDGSLDDTLDAANCLSINLPVTIIVNGITITINTLEDLEFIQDLFDEFDNDEDFLEFLFPITIILNDYTQIVIENQEQLENFIDECTDDNDVIECVDFVYPISFSIYNSDFQIIDTVIIESDEALYNFLDELEDNPNGAILASLNFPVSLVYADGTIIEVNSNQELEAAINAAEEECDNEEEDCDIEDVAMYLQECYWLIVAYNNDNNLLDYQLFFENDGILTVVVGDDIVHNGTWNLSNTDAGLILNIETDWEDLNGPWTIVDCDDDRFELVQETGTNPVTIVIEQECEDDLPCSAQEINMSLLECVWYPGTNLYNNFVAEHFTFSENGIVIITNTASNETVTGMWDVVLTDEGIFLVLDLPEPYNVLNLEWKVVECADHFIHMISGDNYLVLEQDCQDAYDCPDQEANVGDDCETANGTIGFINENCECQEDDNQFDCPDQQANIGDDCETATGTIGFINENCECQEDDNQFDCPDLQANFGDACENPNGLLGFINENCECQVEDENPFECFGNYALALCDDDVVDGFTEFDLNLIFSNCPEDNVEFNFYETLADAEAEVNPLSSPYVNTSNPQTIYSRVSLAANNDVFEIFEHQLIVEDCSQGNCTELEVDAYLMSCAWIAVSVNGSNDYQDFFIMFNDGQELIIEGQGMNFTGNWSTSEGPNGVVVTFSELNNQFQFLTGDWIVVECTENQIILTNNTTEIVLERDCT